MISLTVLLFLVGNVALVASQFSLFTKTKTITDTTLCRDIIGVNEFSSSGLLDCMMICSNDDDCRRMMYCSSGEPSCTTFIDGTDCITDIGSETCTCFKRKLQCKGQNCKCSLGYYGDKCQHIYKDCADFSITSTITSEVLIDIQPPTSPEPFEIYCNPAGGGWATLLYRTVYCSHENFNRSLSEYETGFGKVTKNMWLGFNKLAQIMDSPGYYILNFLFVMEDDYSNCLASYNNFTLANKDGGYSLNVSAYQSGSLCGNSLMGPVMNSKGQKFSTYDQDFTDSRCATRLGGGWWFANNPNCSRGFLTGTMEVDKEDTRSYWRDDLGTRPFRRVQMRIHRM